MIEPMLLSEIHPSFGLQVRKASPMPMDAAHTHQHVEGNFLLRGSMRYCMRGRIHHLSLGRLTLFWAGAPHQLLDFARKTECVWVVIPLAWFMQWHLREGFVQQLFLGKPLEEPRDCAPPQPEKIFTRWERELQTGNAELRRVVVLEIEARLRRMAVALGKKEGVAGSKYQGGASGLVERATLHVGQHYHEEISIGQVARAVGAHPNYLMQVFKRHCGMSLWEYIARLRISHAQQLLMTSDQKLLDVALDAGFGSVSRFHDLFRRFSLCTPSEYRAVMKGRHMDYYTPARRP